MLPLIKGKDFSPHKLYGFAQGIFAATDWTKSTGKEILVHKTLLKNAAAFTKTTAFLIKTVLDMLSSHVVMEYAITTFGCGILSLTFGKVFMKIRDGFNTLIIVDYIIFFIGRMYVVIVQSKAHQYGFKT